MGEKLKDAFEVARQDFERMSFSEKVSLVKQVMGIPRTWNSIKYDGYVDMKTEFAVTCDCGEHYVYLWKHLDGDVFYVGSGKGERYKSKNRNDEFFKHIDMGDSVVYIILAGVDIKTARFYERYISGSLGLAGYDLANGDNNTNHIGEHKFNQWLKTNKSNLDTEVTHKIEEVILRKVLLDEKFSWSHYQSIRIFKKECGDTYFSSQFGSMIKAG